MDRIDVSFSSPERKFQIGNSINPPGKNEIPQDRIELSGEKLSRLDSRKLDDAVHRLPKVDLHRHLEGAIKPETILRVAHKYGVKLPADTLEALTPHVLVTDKDKTLADFLQKFNVLRQLFVNTDAIREISRQCVLDAKEENIRAMELRFAPTSMAKEKNLDLRDVIDAVIEGVREGEKETGITVSLTTIIPRHKGVKVAGEIEDLTEEYVNKGETRLGGEARSDVPESGWGKITGIDLACDEANFPAAPYAPVFLESEQEGLHRTIHAGEARGADSVRDALEKCHAERIGHGVRAFEDPGLVKELVNKGIVLEMCPTSNVQTGAVDSFENHPLKRFYDMGGRATINTDDPGVCNTDLNKEYLRAINDIGCSLEDVENMILYAVDAIFLPPPIKAALKAKISGEIRNVNANL